MKVFRPGLPAQFIDETAPPEAPTSDTPAPSRPKLTPAMAAALADARHAQLSRMAPKLVETQPTSQPLRAEPDPVPVIPFAAAIAETAVKPAAVLTPKVTSRPKPGTIPEHIRTGGHAQRTPAGQKH